MTALKREAFTWGALGSVMPEILRFLRIISKAQPLPNLQWGLYAIVLIAFCFSAAPFLH